MERYRIHDDVGIYYITMSVVNWLPVFVSEDPCRIVTDSLNYCHEHKGLRVNAYVIMPTHVHAIVFLKRFDPEVLKNTLVDFRKFTGKRLSDFCCSHMPACFAQALSAASAPIASGGSGRQRCIQKELRAKRFTRRNSHICMIIPAARDLFRAESTGASRRLRIGCRTGKWRMTWF